MHDQVIGPEVERALKLLPEGGARARKHNRVLRGQVNEIDRMNRKRPQAGLLARSAKLAHLFSRERALEPAARVSREDLKTVTPFFRG
jgi:hypothetical protein